MKDIKIDSNGNFQVKAKNLAEALAKLANSGEGWRNFRAPKSRPSLK